MLNLPTVIVLGITVISFFTTSYQPRFIQGYLQIFLFVASVVLLFIHIKKITRHALNHKTDSVPILYVKKPRFNNWFNFILALSITAFAAQSNSSFLGYLALLLWPLFGLSAYQYYLTKKLRSKFYWMENKQLCSSIPYKAYLLSELTKVEWNGLLNAHVLKFKGSNRIYLYKQEFVEADLAPFLKEIQSEAKL